MPDNHVITQRPFNKNLLLIVLTLNGLIYFLANVILGPIFVPLIVSGKFPLPDFFNNHNFTNALTGLILAVYPMILFFSAPIVGEINYRIGSKKTLYYCTLMNTLSNLVTLLGINNLNLIIIIIGLSIRGFSGGISTPIKSILTQISTPQERNKNFSIIAIFVSLGFFLGGIIAAEFSNSLHSPYFNSSTPFKILIILDVFSLFLIKKFVPEFQLETPNTPIDFKKIYSGIKQAFMIHDLRNIFIVIVIYTTSWNIFYQFLQIYLADDFKENSVYIGRLYSFMAMWMIFVQFGILRPLGKHIDSNKFLKIIFLLLAISFLLVLLPSSYKAFYFVVPFVAILQAFVQTLLITSIVQKVPQELTTKAHSYHRVMQAMGEFIGPFIGALIALISIKLVFPVASLLILVTIVVWKKSKSN
jgi:DHA1 family tetracycline resistance protein-like MFS transporter